MINRAKRAMGLGDTPSELGFEPPRPSGFPAPGEEQEGGSEVDASVLGTMLQQNNYSTTMHADWPYRAGIGNLPIRAPEIVLGHAFADVYAAQPAPPQPVSKPWPITAPLKKLPPDNDYVLVPLILPLTVQDAGMEDRGLGGQGGDMRSGEQNKSVNITDLTATSYCNAYSLLDQGNTATMPTNQYPQTLRYDMTDRKPLDPVLNPTNGGGYTIRSFSLFGAFAEPLRSPVRISIFAGPTVSLPGAISFNWSPQEFAGFKEMIEPAHFLYDQVFSNVGDLVNITVGACNLRIGGSHNKNTGNQYSNIVVYITCAAPIPAHNLTVFASAIRSYIATPAYPLRYNSTKNKWFTQLNCSESDMELTYDERFSTGMWWPVAWSYRLCNSAMLTGLRGVATLLQQLGNQANVIFPPSEKESFFGADIALSKGRGAVVDSRVAGGDPAMGITNFTVNRNHEIMGFTTKKTGDVSDRPIKKSKKEKEEAKEKKKKWPLPYG